MEEEGWGRATAAAAAVGPPAAAAAQEEDDDSSSVLVVLFSFFPSSGRLRILGGGRVGAAVPLSRMKDSLDAPTRSSKAAAASKGPLRKCGREKSISFSGSVRHARRRR